MVQTTYKAYPKTEVWACTPDEYHSCRESVSRSEIEVLRQSPRLFYRRFVSREAPPESSPALDFGTIWHDLSLMEDGNYAAIPEDVLAADGSRRGKKYSEFITRFHEQNPGKKLVKKQDAESLQRMLQSIHDCPLAWSLLFGPDTQREVAIRWHDDLGICRRSRLDVLSPRAIVDLKSVTDVTAKGFASSAYRYGYHRQHAWYVDAAEALTGERLPFYFVCVEKQEPFGCEVYQLDEAFVRRGDIDNRALLAELRTRRCTNDWESPTFGKTVTLSMPRWAEFDSEWEA